MLNITEDSLATFKSINPKILLGNQSKSVEISVNSTGMPKKKTGNKSNRPRCAKLETLFRRVKIHLRRGFIKFLDRHVDNTRNFVPIYIE